MKFYNTKTEELVSALKTELDVNHGDIEQAVNSLESSETLGSLSGSDFVEMWNLCKVMNGYNLESIEKFKGAYFTLQKLQTEKVKQLLHETLQELLQNSYLPMTESHRLIDAESMLLNEGRLKIHVKLTQDFFLTEIKQI